MTIPVTHRVLLTDQDGTQTWHDVHDGDVGLDQLAADHPTATTGHALILDPACHGVHTLVRLGWSATFPSAETTPPQPDTTSSARQVVPDPPRTQYVRSHATARLPRGGPDEVEHPSTAPHRVPARLQRHTSVQCHGPVAVIPDHPLRACSRPVTPAPEPRGTGSRLNPVLPPARRVDHPPAPVSVAVQPVMDGCSHDELTFTSDDATMNYQVACQGSCSQDWTWDDPELPDVVRVRAVAAWQEHSLF